MRNLGWVILLAVCFCVSAAAQEVTPAERDVRKLEREWLDAYEKYDAEAMKRIVADGFAITFTDGSMQTKEQVVQSVSRPRPAGPSTKLH